MRFQIHQITRAALALTLTSALACKRTPPSARRHAPAGPLAVAFVGCESVRRGPSGLICELSPERTLTLWVSSTCKPPLALRAGDHEVAPSAVIDTSSGKRYTLTIPTGARLLRAEDAAGRRWALRLSSKRPHALIHTARALRKDGREKQAEDLLRRALPSLDREDRTYANALLGRIALARGESRAAVELLDRNRARADDLGMLSQAVDDALALSFLLTVNLRQFTRARRVLAQARSLAKDWPKGLAGVPYYEGLVAWESGDVRTALRAFRDAAKDADRLGLGRPLRHAQQQIALTLASLGRTAEALRAQGELLKGEAEEPPCTRADLHTNLAWITSLDSRHADLALRANTQREDPVATHLARARELLKSCPDPFRQRNALINETLWALERGAPQSAEQHATRLRTLEGGRNAQLAIWQEEALGRTALARDEPRQALKRFEHQAELAEAIAHEEGRFRAWSGIGRARERLGQQRQAASAYRKAELILTRWLEWVPFSEGRDAFLGDRDGNARRLVDLLVRRGDAAGAATAARLARARLLRATTRPDQLAHLSPQSRSRWERAVGRYRRLRQALEAQAADDWTLPADALAAARSRRRERLGEIRAALDDGFRVLHGASTRRRRRPRPPKAGELQLIYFPGRQGWIGIAVLPTGATAKQLASGLAGKGLLEPFSRQIERAGQITVFPYGALRDVDFHALAWRNGKLLDHAPVSYAVDADLPAGGQSRQTTALIVGDPQGDLPHAREEARRVAKALQSRSPLVLKLLIGADATRAATLRALPRAMLFHYAGHATFGGTEGADSALLLHEARRLSLGDILALPRAPRAVVLSACESAQTSAKAAVGTGLGLAHAFVAAGSELVIAPVRPVADWLARAVAAAVFAKAATDPTDLARALRATQRRLARSKPNADWASFRVLRP